MLITFEALLFPAEEKLKCYTCLGRDYDSCAVGSVTCAGSCFKLVDEGNFNFFILRFAVKLILEKNLVKIKKKIIF